MSVWLRIRPLVRGLLLLVVGLFLGGVTAFLTVARPLMLEYVSLLGRHRNLQAALGNVEAEAEAQALTLFEQTKEIDRLQADLGVEANARKRFEESLASLTAELEQLRKNLTPPSEPEAPTLPPESFENSVGMNLRLVPAGAFLMGDGRDSPTCEVKVSSPYYLAITEVSAEQWERVMHASPSYGTGRQPAGGLTWDEAVDFCQKLSSLESEKQAGRSYRLPTEAEWENACRGGTDSRFAFGNDEAGLEKHGWFAGNSAGISHEIGTLLPNRWGFHDMHGNLSEWCLDWFAPRLEPPPSLVDPCGPNDGFRRVCRGGNFLSPADECGSGHRERYEPGDSMECFGLRVAMSLPGKGGGCWAGRVEPDVRPGVRRRLGIVHNSVGIELKELPAGKFEMGALDAAPGEDRRHPVTISKAFFVSVYEVTNQQWERVTGEQPPGAGGSPYVPVTGVTWVQADGFCDILSRLPAERAAGRRYRLPTEAEWEYACRAGEKKAFCFGDNLVLLSDYAWHGGNARNQLHPVGFKRPNAWGLYDMHGNAAEWCHDFWAAYPRGAVQDPEGPVRGEKRVVRGGNWANLDVHDYESATRDKKPPNDLLEGILGFRIVMELGEPIPTSKK